MDMEKMYNPDHTLIAKKLRKEMTKEERHLWYDFLRDYPVRFYRQKVIGFYVVDFYCSSAALVVELDGSQHYDEEGMKKDKQRTEYLEQFGLFVFRVVNNDLMQRLEGVSEAIDLLVKTRSKQKGSP